MPEKGEMNFIVLAEEVKGGANFHTLKYISIRDEKL